MNKLRNMFPLMKIHQISERNKKPNGDSTLIQYFDHFTKSNILVDSGLRKGVVSGYLKSIGVNELDLVIASHIDKDHIGGLNNVLKNVDVKELWIMNINIFEKFIEKTIDFEMEKTHLLYCLTEAYKSIQTAKEKNVRCVPVHEGDKTFVGPFLLEVLWPPRAFEEFLNNPANIEDILKTDKGRTFKKFLEKRRTTSEVDKGLETEVVEPKEIELESLDWVSERSRDFDEYSEEVFLKNFSLASRGLFNNVSIVVRISCLSPPCYIGTVSGSCVMLFPGDLEDWNYLYSKYFRYIDADILKIPHHGSKNVEINGNSLYKFLNPRFSLIFPFPHVGLPKPIVRNILVHTGIVFCTSCKNMSFSKNQRKRSCYHVNNCLSLDTAVYELSSFGIKINDGRNLCAGFLRPR